MAEARRNNKKPDADTIFRAIASSTSIETGQSIDAVERKLKSRKSKFLPLTLAR